MESIQGWVTIVKEKKGHDQLIVWTPSVCPLSQFAF